MAPGREASAANWKRVLTALAGAAALAACVGLAWTFLPRDIVPLAALAVAATGAALSGLALVRAGSLRRSSEKMSSDIDAVSRRLVRLDADLSQLSRRDYPDPQSAVEEVTAEIGLLGGLVRDIAVTMALHEKDIAGLRGAPSAAAAAAPASTMNAVSLDAIREEPATRFEAGAALRLPLRPEVREADPPPRAALLPEEAASSAVPASSAVVEPVPIRAAPAPSREPEPTLDSAREAAILQAFDRDRGVELFLQAIVALPQRKLKLYEAQPRLRVSEQVLAEAAEFVPVLERHGRLADLDRLVLARSAVIARHLALRGSEALVLFSLSPAAVAMPGFIRAVGQFAEAHAEIPSRLILGLSQRCWRTLDAERIAALAAMRERGLTFLLDRAEDLHFDAAALSERGVRYVKVSAEALLDAARSESGAAEPAGAEVAALLSSQGVSLVADAVEREQDVPDLIELGAALAQGGIFAPPRAVRADALTPPPGMAVQRPPIPETPAAPGTGAGSEPSSVAAERKPFRAFLRRAG